VTATRSLREVFLTPAPVAVIDTGFLRRTRPNTVTDLFRELPGLDVNGVGVQQPRPIIRGQRGQRILLLQDGMRLNNSRRQQDFGELPGLVDISAVQRVEVVRGPSSVLYGTDAIGGVVNIITRTPDREGVHGNAGYQFGGAGEVHRGSANLYGRSGAFDFLAGASVREADSYRAPSGSFGDIVLDEETVVNRTGVQDRSAQLRLGWTLSPQHHVFVRGEMYDADDAAFGFVDPEDYAPGQPSIDITYPEQRFRKAAFGWTGTELRLPFADGAQLLTWLQDNERRLDFDLFTSFGPQAPPGAGLQINTFNVTDLETIGLRLEARKLASPALLLTYGIDFFRDRSQNTDSSVTTVIGFGPPQTEVANTPLVPDATYRSIGAFLQGELALSPRFTLILGGRVQSVGADTEPLPGNTESFEAKDNTAVVGSANAAYQLTENLTLVGTVGRAFRSPNLIEWFFDGPTPEGNGYQVRSLDLEPETSLNVDLGVRWRSPRLYLEAFAFRNEVKNGIRIAPLDRTMSGMPAFTNVNVEELLFRGIELAGEAALPAHLTANASYTWLDTEDELDPSNPIGDSFSSKVSGGLRYTHPSDRFWLGYGVRHNGRRSDVTLGDNPVGDELPAFTVHHLRGGITLIRTGAQTHRIGFGIQNLTDELYAEFSNVSFFRPEPRRHITVSYELAF
jgi:outer membrane receptor protein involved in Fe transport